MAFHAGQFVKAYIGGANRTEYVVSYQRISSLCELGDTFVLELDPDCPLPDPYNTVRIDENYGGSEDIVLRGYVQSVERTFDPGSIIVNGQDKSILLDDYFIADQIESTGQTVDYWIEYVCNLVGLDVSFEATCGGIIVEDGTPIGMQHASQVILQLERLAAYYTQYSSHADKVIVFRLGSSEPVLSTGTVTRSAKREMGTEKTRNVVKVYGGFAWDWITGIAYQVFAQARTDMPELVADKTIVLANPYLRRQTYAYIVADRILNVVNSIDDVQTYELAGFYPSVQVGQYFYINISKANYTYRGDRRITTIQTFVDEAGVITAITIGEKCPRISIQLPIPPIYVTDTLDGVGVSWNGGDSFQLSNAGLTSTDEKDGRSIAANSYGQQMVITAAGLYKRYSSQGTWIGVTGIPDPTNTSNDPIPLQFTDLGLVRVIDAPTVYNTFHFLASGIVTVSGVEVEDFYRAWVYSTDDFGINWRSLQLYVPYSGGYKEHPYAPSGMIFDVWAHDLHAGIDNKCFALCSTREEADQDIATIYAVKLQTSAVARFGYFDGTTFTYDSETMPGAIRSMRIYSVPGNRNVAYACISSLEGNTSLYRGCHTTVYRTKDNGTTWTLIHDSVLLNAYEDDDANPRNHGIHFDNASTETLARIVFSCWKRTSDYEATVYLRWIEDTSVTENTNVTDNTFACPLDSPSLEEGESFSGYDADANAEHTPDTAEVNARTYRVAGTNYGFIQGGGYKGTIYDSESDPINGYTCNPFVKLQFNNKIATKLNSLCIRGPLVGGYKHGSTLSTDANDSLYSVIGMGYYKVNAIECTFLAYAGAVAWRGNFACNAADDPMGWYDGVSIDKVTYADGDQVEINYKLHPTWRSDLCSSTRRQHLTGKYWAFLSYQNGLLDRGFCESDDTITWTEIWDTGAVDSYACFDWRTFS